jgi:hypothetical protein
MLFDTVRLIQLNDFECYVIWDPYHSGDSCKGEPNTLQVHEHCRPTLLD